MSHATSFNKRKKRKGAILLMHRRYTSRILRSSSVILAREQNITEVLWIILL